MILDLEKTSEGISGRNYEPDSYRVGKKEFEGKKDRKYIILEKSILFYLVLFGFYIIQ